ncbi:MAG: hypothetical protein ACRDFR_07735, partial [Candidatus Limnocylindria bacterium]
MPDIQIRLAAMWVALMLTYLLGDVLRIFSSSSGSPSTRSRPGPRGVGSRPEVGGSWRSRVADLGMARHGIRQGAEAQHVVSI